MIPLFTRAEMRAIDAAASAEIGLPSLVLMESAGVQALDAIAHTYPARLDDVLIVAGEGQNGGDGWVVARHLCARGRAPRCVLVGDPSRVRGDAQINLAALHKLGVAVRAVDGAGLAELEAQLERASLIVDALFGTGLSRPLEGIHARAVDAINATRAARGVPVCALDLPSGIDADTGRELGRAVQASLTVTFAGHKLGLHQFPGVARAGALICVDIGVPATGDDKAGLIEARDLGVLLAPRPADSHKGSRGHLLALAGSAGKTGAAVLSALGAMRAGAGLVTIAADADTRRALDFKVLELMTAELSADAPRESALALAEGKGAALLGPGFGLDGDRRRLAQELARALPIPCVLDADALTAVAADVPALMGAAAPRVLTPHPGEAARLLGIDTKAVQADRYAAARAIATRSGQVAVLKGARTVIAAPDGRLRVCRAGTPALGVAGTGDVLAGVIAAQLSSHSDAFDAACAAVQLHAVAGEIAAISDGGMLASEVAHALPRALERLRRERGQACLSNRVREV